MPPRSKRVTSKATVESDSNFPPVKDLTPQRAMGKRQTRPSVGEENAKTQSRSPPKKKTKASDVKSKGALSPAELPKVTEKTPTRSKRMRILTQKMKALIDDEAEEAEASSEEDGEPAESQYHVDMLDDLKDFIVPDEGSDEEDQLSQDVGTPSPQARKGKGVNVERKHSNKDVLDTIVISSSDGEPASRADPGKSQTKSFKSHDKKDVQSGPAEGSGSGTRDKGKGKSTRMPSQHGRTQHPDRESSSDEAPAKSRTTSKSKSPIKKAGPSKVEVIYIPSAKFKLTKLGREIVTAEIIKSAEAVSNDASNSEVIHSQDDDDRPPLTQKPKDGMTRDKESSDAEVTIKVEPGVKKCIGSSKKEAVTKKGKTDKDTPIPQPAENDAGFLNILEVITLSDEMKQKYSCLRPAWYRYLEAMSHRDNFDQQTISISELCADLNDFQFKWLMDGLDFVSCGLFVNPARADPAKHKRATLSNGRGTACFLTTGRSGLCFLQSPTQDRAGIRFKLIHLEMIATETECLFAFCGDIYGLGQSVVANVINLGDPPNNHVPSQMIFQTRKENYSGSPAKKANPYLSRVRENVPKTARPFVVPNQTLVFMENVPIYDIRQVKDWAFDASHLEKLTTYPLYRKGAGDVPEGSVISVGYVPSCFKGGNSGIDDVLMFSVAFMLLLARATN
ncbi:hypothetical protein ARMGADRAFT_1088475 [Armillaria gallica]|uniref:Uncharacterized protein n=1 Tax=Armillaria gallica TaxID=47427 RepID=A0A2H3D116_ARMGA|nr:hypothetical protein ARMGADRAFT_1088475 [Armillaria gallica]